MADRVVNYVFRGNFSNLTAGLTAAGRSTAEYGNKLTALDKQGSKMRAGLTTIGTTAGKIGLVAAAGLGAIVVATANFDKAMSGVQAATHETAGNMEELRAAAIKAGADTAFSASEAADAIEQLAKAGVSTKDILGGGLSGALSLAAAGQLDVGQAAEIAATALTQFKLAGSDVSHVADLLAAGAGKAQGDVTDMGMALKQSGLVAAQTGLTIEETTGTLAAFASAGLIGSDAGTSFKTMLQALTPSSKEAQKQLDALGISAYDSQGNFIGMTKFAGELHDSLARLSPEARNAALKVIFGSDAVRAASVIYQQGAKGVDSWINKVDDSGYAAKTAAIQLDNLSGDMEKFRGSLETALIGAGEGSQGPLRKLVQGATGAVNAFNNLSPAAQSSTTALLGITAVTGGGLWFGAKVITGISNAKDALGKLEEGGSKSAAALGKVGRAAGIASAALAGLAIIDAVQSSSTKALPGVEALTGDLLRLAQAGDSAGATLPQQFDDLGSSIERLADPNMAQALQDNISGALGGIGGGSELKNARAEIESLDAALTSLVANAGPQAAAKAFASLNESGQLTATQLRDLGNLLPNYTDAMAGAANKTAFAGGAAKELAGGAKAAAAGTTQLSDALKKEREDAQQTAASFVGLGKSLNDPKKSLSEWLHSLQEQTAALRNFRVNAQNAAKKGLDEGLIASLEKAGPEGAMRMRQLANATDAEIGRANKTWRQGQQEINRYTNFVAAVPKNASTNLHVNGATEASAAIRRIISQLAQIPRSLRTTYYVNQVNSISRPHMYPGSDGQNGSADGGTVPKTGLAYADRHPYLLADGEEVISNRNGQADRNRALLKAINAGRLADGGTAGRVRFTGYGSMSSPDFSSLNAAMSYLADHIKGAGKGIEHMASSLAHELTIRQKLVQNEIDRDKQRLDNLKQERQAVVDMVSGAYHSDPFGSNNAGAYAAYGFSPSQVAAIQVKQEQATIKGNISNEREALRLLKILRQRGLNGPAYVALAAQGDVATLQAYVDMSASQLRQYERNYNTDQRLQQKLGNYAGDATYGHAINAQTKELREHRTELKHVNGHLAVVTQKLAQIERIQSGQAEEMGRHVGGAINGAAVAGHKGRVKA